MEAKENLVNANVALYEYLAPLTAGIANPPCVRIQTLTKSYPEAVAYYKDRYKAANKGNYDLYVVFVERGLELLDAPHGQLGYILPHKFFNSRYGESLRALISSGQHLRHIVHFGDHMASAHSSSNP